MGLKYLAELMTMLAIAALFFRVVVGGVGSQA